MSVDIKSIAGDVLYTSSASSVRDAAGEAVASGANLSGANLYGADLSRADLSRADLSGANLYGADLSGADLSGADLDGADLDGADLSGADLYRANLSRANLSGANLDGVLNGDAPLAQTRILPDEGDVIGWKRASGALVKLLIPADAKRSNGSGRKCRAEKALVLAITDMDGNAVETAVSAYDPKFTYRVGETVTPTVPFDEHRWNECAPGIHFYITRAEAEHHA